VKNLSCPRDRFCIFWLVSLRPYFFHCRDGLPEDHQSTGFYECLHRRWRNIRYRRERRGSVNLSMAVPARGCVGFHGNPWSDECELYRCECATYHERVSVSLYCHQQPRFSHEQCGYPDCHRSCRNQAPERAKENAV